MEKVWSYRTQKHHCICPYLNVGLDIILCCLICTGDCEQEREQRTATELDRALTKLKVHHYITEQEYQSLTGCYGEDKYVNAYYEGKNEGEEDNAAWRKGATNVRWRPHWVGEKDEMEVKAMNHGYTSATGMIITEFDLAKQLKEMVSEGYFRNWRTDATEKERTLTEWAHMRGMEKLFTNWKISVGEIEGPKMPLEIPEKPLSDGRKKALEKMPDVQFEQEMEKDRLENMRAERTATKFEISRLAETMEKCIMSDEFDEDTAHSLVKSVMDQLQTEGARTKSYINGLAPIFQSTANPHSLDVDGKLKRRIELEDRREMVNVKEKDKEKRCELKTKKSARFTMWETTKENVGKDGVVSTHGDKKRLQIINGVGENDTEFENMCKGFMARIALRMPNLITCHALKGPASSANIFSKYLASRQTMHTDTPPDEFAKQGPMGVPRWVIEFVWEMRQHVGMLMAVGDNASLHWMPEGHVLVQRDLDSRTNTNVARNTTAVDAIVLEMGFDSVVCPLRELESPIPTRWLALFLGCAIHGGAKCMTPGGAHRLHGYSSLIGYNGSPDTMGTHFPGPNTKRACGMMNRGEVQVTDIEVDGLLLDIDNKINAETQKGFKGAGQKTKRVVERNQM